MIKIKKHLKEFVVLLDILRNVSIETNIEFKKDSIFIRFVAPSGFALGLIELTKEFFESYTVEKEQILAVDTTLFYKIVKKLSKKELEIEILHDGAVIKCKSEASFFNLKTYVVPEDERPIPTPEFKSVWNIDTDEFLNLITEHLEFSDVANFKSEGNTLKTIMKSNMVSGEILTTAESILKEDTACYYDIKLLSIILGIKTIFKTIKFSFGDTLPCKIEGKSSLLNFTWFLAPRVGDDE